MRFDHSRSDWVRHSRPVTGPAFPGWQAMQRIVIHWPGADWEGMDFNRDGTEDYRDTAVLMDNTNAYYWNRKPSGYAIGYNAAVDVFGHTWQLRGTDFRCAANSGVNDTSFAILVIVDKGVPANAAQRAGIKDLIGQAFVLAGRELPVVRHMDVGQTQCCGPDVGGQVVSGDFLPSDELPTPVLKLGDRGDRVAVLRDHLVFWKMATKPGRIFTPATRLAVKRWQRSLGVRETGRYDVATFDAYRKQVGQ
jgi:hypothetical protein